MNVSTLLILLLLKLRFNLTKYEYDFIKNAFCFDFFEISDEIGWEEISYANISYIIKVELKKEADNSQINLHRIDDIEKYKKHMTMLFEKISKGSLSIIEKKKKK